MPDQLKASLENLTRQVEDLRQKHNTSVLTMSNSLEELTANFARDIPIPRASPPGVQGVNKDIGDVTAKLLTNEQRVQDLAQTVQQMQDSNRDIMTKLDLLIARPPVVESHVPSSQTFPFDSKEEAGMRGNLAAADGDEVHAGNCQDTSPQLKPLLRPPEQQQELGERAASSCDQRPRSPILVSDDEDQQAGSSNDHSQRITTSRSCCPAGSTSSGSRLPLTSCRCQSDPFTSSSALRVWPAAASPDARTQGLSLAGPAAAGDSKASIKSEGRQGQAFHTPQTGRMGSGFGVSSSSPQREREALRSRVTGRKRERQIDSQKETEATGSSSSSSQAPGAAPCKRIRTPTERFVPQPTSHYQRAPPRPRRQPLDEAMVKKLDAKELMLLLLQCYMRARTNHISCDDFKEHVWTESLLEVWKTRIQSVLPSALIDTLRDQRSSVVACQFVDTKENRASWYIGKVSSDPHPQRIRVAFTDGDVQEYDLNQEVRSMGDAPREEEDSECFQVFLDAEMAKLEEFEPEVRAFLVSGTLFG
ncbi:hypothetical protein GUITHDRAFT_117286 [Guillardia theta CCMP2712]|uniref:Uncharacterized protein n=1 Tax=Guillardia theta (strain CCMP2712) TaxID=905079 RepID=L1IK64_GUITC|nr:hypothetical protein GUITHDRAFT_117286 [Guillardia theta CCMP2712]EKX36507.1 hypothetical protein GUITHDRAFT_117286 [Guillardia theta CCMP2712]|eukprot:XP_005823487.1 hypothetical protein GUITHDRAFT_117286 [Guillardia theta CCMP2712]